MSRRSRKRGKQVKKKSISKEQVCIATAIDRQGNLIMELAHIQHINTLHSNLRKWMNRFNGVYQQLY